MDLPETYKTLIEFADDTIDRARKNLNTTGFAQKNRKINASGKLSKGLGYKVNQNDAGIKIEFTSKENYAPFVEDGRNSGYAPYRVLEKWIKEKKIRLRKRKPNALSSTSSVFTQMTPQAIRSAAIAMAKSMGKPSYKRKPTRFFESAILTEFKDLPNKVGIAMVNDLENVIIDEFKKSDNIKATKT